MGVVTLQNAFGSGCGQGGKGFYLREPEQSIIPAKRNIILLLAGDGRTNWKKIIILMEPNRKSVNVGEASMPEASERMARKERGGFINKRISNSAADENDRLAASAVSKRGILRVY